MLIEQEQNPTPTENSGLEQKLGTFETITQALDYAARGETGFNFYSPRGKLAETLPYRVLRDRAVETGRRLMRLGFDRGDRVGVVAETSSEFMTVFFGCQYAGLVPCSLPYNMHMGGREAHVSRLANMLRAAGAKAVIASDALMDQITQAAIGAGIDRVLSHDMLAEIVADGVDLAPFGADDVAYIQYSSGSTSDPKGVLITQRAIAANAHGILNHGLKITPADRAVSWLPLYHDMGLVGFCLAPVMGQVTVDYLATSAFARRPLLWLGIISDNKATITYSPSFGYDLATRRANGSAGKFDLSGLRIAGIGGDMVRADVLDAFAEKFAAAKFRREAYLASYGMAESTLAVSFAPIDTSFEIDEVDRAHYKNSGRAVPVDAGRRQAESARSFVICGKPLPGHAIEIRGDDGRVLGEREIGHVLISGPSLMAGYFQNDEASSAAFDEGGWLRTGDMGYMLDGQVIITGRAKDLILHNGRNIWPQDIEWAVEKIDPLRSGDVAAFAVEAKDDEERVTVLVQCRLAAAGEREALRGEITATVYRQAGIECDVVLVPPRSLPFTSSGKLSRAAAKLRYLSGEFADASRKLVSGGIGAAEFGMAQGPQRS